jgi:hypothetical protein
MKLKQRLGIQVEPKTTEIAAQIEPIHRPSFSIGDSLGDIKVALMDLKTRSERIECSMLGREYFEQTTKSRDKNDLIIGKLDEALRVLAESQPKKPSIEPSIPSIEPSKTSMEPRIPSSTEEAEERPKKAEVSLRLQQILEIFKTRRRTTPRQLSKVLGIQPNTACEHLRELQHLGYLRRVRRGLYEVLS